MGNCSGSSVEPPNPDRVDLTHFELLKVVGKGGFGKVNAITHLATQELLALKRIEKHRIIKSKSHLNMVWTERQIMSIVRSPFLCHLRYAFESDTELFLVMAFLQGGDLRFHLKERGRMREDSAKFYAAQMVLGLEELHRHHIVYRDLKPENVLLDAKGNLQITDFGLAYMLREDDKRRTRGQAGTRGYMAPETMGVKGYGLSVDYFSFGVMLYELLHGARPWKNIDTSMAMMGLEGEIDPLAAVRNHKSDKDREREDALRGLGAQKESVTTQTKAERESGDDEDEPDVIRFSSRLSEDAKSLLLALLEFNPNKRLGCMPQHTSAQAPHLGWSSVKAHPWFASIDWAAMEAGSITPPFLPDITHANCTPDADLADQLLDKKPKRIRDDEQAVFQGWSWNTKLRQDDASGDAPVGIGTVGKNEGDGGVVDGSVSAGLPRVGKEEEEQKVEVIEERIRNFQVRKSGVDGEREEKSYEDGVMAAVSVSEQLPGDSNNSSSMTAEDRREEKRDTVLPLNSSVLPLPSATAAPAAHSNSPVTYVPLPVTAAELTSSSANNPSSQPATPLIIQPAHADAPTAQASPATNQQTATTPIHLPVAPLSPPSHHRNSSPTSSIDDSGPSSTATHRPLASASSASSTSIHLGFATPLTSQPSSSRPSLTSALAGSHATHRHSQSAGGGLLAAIVRDGREDGEGSSMAVSGSVVPSSADATVLSGDRQERRSMKEKRELKPTVAAEHARASSTSSVHPAAIA